MHPVSTALLLLGYGLSLPIVFRLVSIVANQQRVAFVGHQVGMSVALLGWLVSGRAAMAIIHGLWLVAARIWFGLAGRERAAQRPA